MAYSIVATDPVTTCPAVLRESVAEPHELKSSLSGGEVKQIDELEENEKQSILTVIDIALAKKRFKDNLSNLLTT